MNVLQIKAARALLDWTQRDLAKASGISLAAIAQIESGAGNPRTTTMKLIQQTFEKYDVEFSDDPGVRIRHEPFVVHTWHGKEAIPKVWKDIETTLAGVKNAEVLLSSLDDAVWEKYYSKELPIMLKRRQELGITTRSLIKSSKDYHYLSAENFRIVPKALFTHAPYYVYADRVTILKMLNPIRVVFIINPTLAESFRSEFEYHWSNGKKP